MEITGPLGLHAAGGCCEIWASPEQIIPHQPAGEEAVALAEAASGFLLPASYTAFLRLTNGLGLDLQEHNSVTGCEGKSSHICSVMGRRPWMQSDRCGGLVAHP